MTDWILLQSGFTIYIILSLALLGGAIGLPIPEDLPLLIGGIFLHQGKVKGGAIFLVCYLSVVLGDLLIYYIGRRFGPGLFERPWFQKRFSRRKIKLAKLNLEKRSLLTIFIARHLFYLRSLTFLTCGAVRMRPKVFFLADSFAALISTTLMLGLGYLASNHYEKVLRGISTFKDWSLIIGVIAIAGYLLYRKRKTMQAEESSEA